MNHLARGLLQVQALEIMVFIDRDRECLVLLEPISETVLGLPYLKRLGVVIA